MNIKPFLLVLALAAPCAVAQPAQPATPTVNAEAVEATTTCYLACYRDFAEIVLAHDRQHHFSFASNTQRCRHLHNVILAAHRCDSGCNEIWTAHGKPPSKIRTKYQTEIAADKTRYSGHACATIYSVNDDLAIPF